MRRSTLSQAIAAGLADVAAAASSATTCSNSVRNGTITASGTFS